MEQGAKEIITRVERVVSNDLKNEIKELTWLLGYNLFEVNARDELRTKIEKQLNTTKANYAEALLTKYTLK